MSLGPIEMFVVGFPENGFTGEIAPALAELVETGPSARGSACSWPRTPTAKSLALEVNELDDQISGAYHTLVDEVHGLIGEEDVEDFAEELEPGRRSRILVVEHVWAKSFADAAANAGGSGSNPLQIPRTSSTNSPAESPAQSLPTRGKGHEMLRRTRWTGSSRGDDRGGGRYRRRRTTPPREQVRGKGSGGVRRAGGRAAGAVRAGARAGSRGGRR